MTNAHQKRIDGQRQMILDALAAKPITIEALLVVFPKWDYYDLLTVLSEMEDEKRIEMVEGGFVGEGELEQLYKVLPLQSKMIRKMLEREFGGHGNAVGYATRILFAGGRSKNLPRNEETLLKTHNGIEFQLLPFRPGLRNHRCYIRCSCGHWIPAGRLGQHKCRVATSEAIRTRYMAHFYNQAIECMEQIGDGLSLPLAISKCEAHFKGLWKLELRNWKIEDGNVTMIHKDLGIEYIISVEE